MRLALSALVIALLAAIGWLTLRRAEVDAPVAPLVAVSANEPATPTTTDAIPERERVSASEESSKAVSGEVHDDAEQPVPGATVRLVRDYG